MNAATTATDKTALAQHCFNSARDGRNEFWFKDGMADKEAMPSSKKVIRPSKKNNKPNIGKFTADGILAVIAAVDMFQIEYDPVAMKGLDYMRDFAAYLKSDAYRAKSEKQARISQEWRVQNGQSRDRAKKVQPS